MVTCNTTLEDAYITETPIIGDSFTVHHLFLWVAAAFGLVSIVISFFLIFAHATHYSKPWEQKFIIRILLMIPIYSTVSFLSFLNYRHSIYYQVLRDCYEAFAIASFFTLLCNYIAPNLHDQKDYFRSIKPKNWFWGVFGLQKCTGGRDRGPLRVPRSGLTWFNVIYVAVFQYCFVRVFFTIVSVVTQAFGRYCDASSSPAFAHFWVMVFEAASVTVAMFCLIQFYLQLRVTLADHRPFLKVLCIKLVIFFSFWQTFVISFLSSSHGPLHPSAKIAYSDIKIGIPSVLLCIEMAIFAVMHVFAFPWTEYTLSHVNGPFKAEPYAPDDLNGSPPASAGRNTQYYYQGGPLGIRALGQAFNPWDIIKASARGFRWLFIGRRNRFQDVSYSSNMNGPPVGKTAGAPGVVPEPDFQPGAEMSPMKTGGAGYPRPGRGDDRDALLAHAETVGSTAPSGQLETPYRENAVPPLRAGDLGQPSDHHQQQQYTAYDPTAAVTMPDAGMYGGAHYGHEDTGYHGGRGGVGMAYSGEEEERGWDHGRGRGY